MGGSKVAALILVVAMSAAASAQTSAPDPSDGSRDPAAPNLINRDYLTSTGETVPRPGASQSAGVTTLDRAIQRRDDAVEKGICSNC